jgi:anion transporter
VSVIEADDWFGESALFSDRPRTATVVARTDTELWRLPRDKFHALIEENPWLTFHFMEVIGDRLQTENRRLSQLRSSVARWLAARGDAVDGAELAEIRAALDGGASGFEATTARAVRPAMSERMAAIAATAGAERRRAIVGAVLGVLLGAGIAAMPAPEGLSPAGQRMLALLGCAALFWAFDVLPDYAVGLALLLAWIVLDIVPAEVAVSGFTSGPFFLIIGVLGMAAALQASGLLFRMALHVLKRFPLSHRGQSVGLALSGAAITSCVPDVTSGVAIAAPITLALSDSLGYARRSRGSAGLAMAAVAGFGQMSPFFLTGAAENLLGRGLLPAEQQAAITWTGWLLAALPLAIVTFAGGLAATFRLLPPETQPTTSAHLVATQIEALGSLSRAEILSGIVLAAAIVGWITAPVHGVDVAWVALMGLTAVTCANLLDRVAFRAAIFWDFLFYLAAVLSLTGVVRHLQIDAWLIRQVEPVLVPLTAYPGLFLLGLMLAIFAARFVLPSFPLVSLLTITALPIATRAGIQPLAFLLVMSTAVTVWFLPYQSAYYLALYFGTKEQAFTHRQVRPIAWSYGLIYLLGVAVSIPWWHALGLLP